MGLINNVSRLFGDDLKQTIRAGAKVKIAAACFSIYAYEALKKELEKVDKLREKEKYSAYSMIAYDLLGEIAEKTLLTRQLSAQILTEMNAAVFSQYRHNPEHFISEAARLINEQKANVIIEHLSYHVQKESYLKEEIFTAPQKITNFGSAVKDLKHHIYDYVVTDSKIEREFAKELDNAGEVAVYAKLPRGFLIPTPVGDYNPDWAIAFNEGEVRHVYFVAETKGSLSSLELRAAEKSKIDCAKKFFAAINERYKPKKVIYDVVDNFESLMRIIH